MHERSNAEGLADFRLAKQLRKAKADRKEPAWKAAIRVLRRLGQPAVMWGDEGLLHEIAEELGWPHEGPRTSDRVMRALNKSPGQLVKNKTLVRRHWVSIFRLPEHS